jgi:perosamine synthetase
VEYFDARPVFCDIRKDTKNINETLIESLITKKTKAIIPVHFAGHPCEMDTIMNVAKKYRLKVIEDAAHCTPAYYKRQSVGTIGDITCFSFYVNKCITTGEGGMAVTNNRRYAEHIKEMSLHGMTKDAWKRYDKHGSWFYDVAHRGFKYNMSDMAATLGLSQLMKANWLWRKRIKAAQRYCELLKEMNHIICPLELSTVRSAWCWYVIRVDNSIDRDDLIDFLSKQGVKIGVHFIPLHLFTFYRKKYGYKKDDFPVAYENFRQTMSLPFYPDITLQEQKYVVGCLQSYLREHER